MTAALTVGRYTGGYGEVTIYIEIRNVNYTSINTGVLSATCNYYGDFISLGGSFMTPNPGTAEGAKVKMESTHSTRNRLDRISIDLRSMDPNFSLLEGTHTLYFTNNTYGSNVMSIRRS